MRLYLNEADANAYWIHRGTLHATPLPLASGILDTSLQNTENCEVDPLTHEHARIIAELLRPLS